MTALRQRGAALLAAMLTVTLVAGFAAAALWQQWRAVEVESAERTRVQSGWLLLGALDWSRLILVEDGRGSSADHLAEPWAVPLEEARLSTFLAADKNVAQFDDASVDTTNAFLSGQITDMQARLNLRNLLGDDTQGKAAQRQLARLMIDAGADAVVGGHPHVTQDTETYRGKPIIYSLGNFLFNGFDTPATTTGWVLSARVDRTDVVDWRTHVARLDANGVPHPDPTASSPCASPDRKVVNQCAGE